MKQWYAVYTKANLETQVADALKGRGIEIFFPQVHVKKAETSHRNSEALFPCYLFLHANLKQLTSPVWQWAPGLRYLVHFEGEPAVVPDLAIDTLRKVVARLNAVSAEQSAPFQPGDVVRITRGPLADLLAVFDGLVDGNRRSQVLVDFLGRICRAKVDLHNLEKVQYSTVEHFSHPSRRTRGRGRPINYGRSDRNR